MPPIATGRPDGGQTARYSTSPRLARSSALATLARWVADPDQAHDGRSPWVRSRIAGGTTTSAAPTLAGALF